MKSKIENLSSAGVSFTLLRHHEKRPLYKKWQNIRHGLNAATKHVDRGGNLGVHVGVQPDGSYLHEFDADYGRGMAQLLAIAPELREGLLSWRLSGSSKAIFRTDAPLKRQATPDQDGEHTKLELIASGQAAIFGMHPSDEPYRCNWKPPIFLTTERVIEIWNEWTGQPYEVTSTPAHTHTSASTPDAGAVGHSMGRVAAVLERLGLPFENWLPFEETGSKIELEQCPFCGEEHHATYDGQAVVLVKPDGRIRATCLKASCQTRISESGRSGWALLKELAGYAPTTPDVFDADDTPTIHELAPALMDVIRHLDRSDWTGATSTTWRNTTAAALAVVKIGVKRGTFDNLSLGVRYVSEIAGLSSATAARALRSLSGWFLIQTTGDGGDPTLARSFSVAQPFIEAAIEACFKLRHVQRLDSLYNNVSQFETCDELPTLRADHMCEDAFLARQTPITESEVKAKIEARNALRASRRAASPWAHVGDAPAHVRTLIAALGGKRWNADRQALCEVTGMSEDELTAAIAEGCELGLLETNGRSSVRLKAEKLPRSFTRKNYIRRLRATVASPGPNVLVLVDLVAAGGPMTRSELAGAAHISRTSAWRTIVQGVAAGCLEIVDGYVCLVDGWESHIEAETPKMPTAGLAKQRKIDNLGARVAYLEYLLAIATEEAEKTRLKRSIEATISNRQKLIKQSTGRVVSVDVAGAKLTNARIDVDSIQTQAQVINASRPRHTMSETDRFLLDHFGSEASADEASARWARLNSQMSAESGSGWWSNMSVPEISLEAAVWAAQGYWV